MSHEFTYPVSTEKNPDGPDYVVRFPDFDEAVTFGMDLEEALSRAPDCLREAMRSRMKDDEDLPSPSKARKGQALIAAPAEIAIKAAVYDAFRRRKTTRVALAEKLNVDESEVRRILDPLHRTKVGRMEQAAKALGSRIRVIVENEG